MIPCRSLRSSGRGFELPRRKGEEGSSSTLVIRFCGRTDLGDNPKGEGRVSSRVGLDELASLAEGLVGVTKLKAEIGVRRGVRESAGAAAGVVSADLSCLWGGWVAKDVGCASLGFLAGVLRENEKADDEIGATRLPSPGGIVFFPALSST